FYRANTVASVAPKLTADSSAEIHVGSVENLYPTGFRQISHPSSIDLARGMRFSHQSTFIKTAFHKENFFLLEDGVAADYAFFLRAHKQGAGFNQINEVISVFDVSG